MTNETKLTILHTNDLHSELNAWPAVTALLKEKRQAALDVGRDVLLFDIGDHSDRVHPVTDALRGKGNIELLNSMDYDAVTIGNNEGITFSKEELNDLYADASFPVLVTNLRDTDTSEKPKWTVPYRMITLTDGTKIGVTAATVPFRQFYEPLGWTIDDPLTALRPVVDQLRQECDFLICLSHLGLREDYELVEAMPEFDLVLGSHTHHVLEEGEHVNGVWINQSGRSGAYIGEVTIGGSKETGLAIERVQSIPVDVQKRDHETENQLSRLNRRAVCLMEEPVTILKEEMYVDWFNESPLVRTLTEGLRSWCQADLAMVNAGSLLDGLKPGLVTRGQLHEICPHPINPVIVEMTGKQIAETVKKAETPEMIHFRLRGFGFRGKVLGKMIYATGSSFAKTQERIDPETFLIDNKRIEEDRVYKVATLDMFTLGRLYPEIRDAQKTEILMPEFLRDILLWCLQNQGGVMKSSG